jgi:hypothetical protein
VAVQADNLLADRAQAVDKVAEATAAELQVKVVHLGNAVRQQQVAMLGLQVEALLRRRSLANSGRMWQRFGN